LSKVPTALIILDGWGISPQREGNAVRAAKTPVLDGLMAQYPTSQLQASGEAVGLMAGQMGDSNVGHLNLGAGRIVYQYVQLISQGIRDGSFFQNRRILEALELAKTRGVALHLMGLVSPGGVHSHTDHLYALLKMAKDLGLPQVYIHAFLDGRDVPPTSALGYMKELVAKMAEIGIGQVATVSGRYYAMDRDRRWERVQKAWEALVEGQGRIHTDPLEAVQAAYDAGETDEFVLPTVIKNNGEAKTIQDGDVVLFFNFRADRARQLTSIFVQEDWDEFPCRRPQVHFLGLTRYDEKLPAPYAFPPQDMSNTLGEVVSRLGWKQLRIAETEKYAHVTFFFSGGEEKPFPGETRRLIPSPKVATYDLQPSMSAPEVAAAAIEEIETGEYDLIILNFANLDMVGHTGIMEAAVQAVETVDTCVGQVVEAIRRCGGQALITADHGNAEQMVDPGTGEPHTAHTNNPVPLILVSNGKYSLREGILADIAPTILDLCGVEPPAEMTGKSLLIKEEK
jgi:2,3-bisphosphoglycerate-independent phosphoglycerate mutase